MTVGCSDSCGATAEDPLQAGWSSPHAGAAGLAALPCAESSAAQAGLTTCVTCGAPVETNEEIDLLREVHEAARQFLCFRGIDKERQDTALVRLVDATETVKGYDGNTP